VAAGAGFALAAVALTVAGLTLAEYRSQRWVLHGREVVRLARTALTLAVDQQTALRGFLLTRDVAWLAPDVAARPRLLPTVDSLVAATADNPAQHARAHALRDALTDWDDAYRVPLLAAVTPGARSGSAPADAAGRIGELAGTARFDAVRTRAGAFLEAEEALYQVRVRHQARVQLGALGAVLLELAVLAGLVLRVGRAARGQTATVFDQQAQLEAQAMELKDQTRVLEEQAVVLKEQAVELEHQTEELAAANGALADALTEETRTRRAAEAAEARVRSVVETATDAIVTSDAGGRIASWNAAAAQIYGYTAEEAVGRPLTMLVPEPRRAGHGAALAELVAGRAPELSGRTLVLTDVRKDGQTIPVELSFSRWEAGGEPFVTSVIRDVSARTALEARLAHEATHDALTGLANRARFRARVADALARDLDRPERVVVLFLDLDDFKAVNDSAGHATGDALLGVVAQRLLEATRGSDTVARLGGDEFGVLLRNTDNAADVSIVAGRLVAAMRRPVRLGDYEAVVGASIGIARGASSRDADALLRDADTAMYAAKAAGKGDYAWFDPAMHAAALARAELQADLGPALERGEFWVAYQPIVALDTGRVQGLEALARWTHPTRGALSPAAFIPVAEASGQIVPLGRWVLAEACRTVATMPGAPYITVNLSARQLADPALVGDVEAVLHASGLAPGRLVLEITETVLMADMAGTLERLHLLKALGVRLAIDDFGTGYSSLRYLQRFPVDVLKIDKSFVDRVDGDAHDAALVRTIVALGEMLGLTTVAEGIERAAQREHLGALGCRLGQGYHFARPLDAAAATAFLAEEEVA
jgi:diguanylate cyclase (GGDEF)-like protein/PAS domain S-box-containing protein